MSWTTVFRSSDAFRPLLARGDMRHMRGGLDTEPRHHLKRLGEPMR